MRKMAGEQQGENAATESLGQHCHSNLGAWVQSCHRQTGSRAAGGKPLASKKAKALTCNISLSVITDDALLTFN